MKHPESSCVLIVDDNVDFVKVLEHTLNEHGFTNVKKAYDGEEGLAKIEELCNEVLVVVLGLAMPKLDGFGVMQSLHTALTIPVGIIMWTGQDSKENRDTFFSLGTENVIPCAFVGKMETVDVLAKEVETALIQISEKRG